MADHPPDRARVLRGALADLQAGRTAAAAAACADFPDDVEALLLRGLALAVGGDAVGAAPILARVAAARPEHAHPLADLARVLAGQGRAAAAEAHFRAAIALAPDDARLRLAFGEYLLAQGRGAESAAEAASVPPDLAAAQNLLGAARVAGGDMAGAIGCFRATVRLAPGGAAGWSNLGKALAAEGDFAAALPALDRACALRPGDPQLGLNRAVALLKSGRLAEGWEAFEIRRALPGHARVPPSRALPAPLPERLDGRAVLLLHEEGFGDTLQFIRYAPLLAARGARVLAQVPPELARIVARVDGVAAVFPLDAPPPQVDFVVPFLSLPRSFATSLATIPVAVPYLSADPLEVAEWKSRLAGIGGRRIGLVWAGAGRPGDPGAAATDRLRSTTPDALAPLAAIPGVRLVSLQKSAAAAACFPLHDPMAMVRDFAATAAVIANLDAVVSVDTAVAHLAGGMGRPVFLLDRHDSCWRWLHGRGDSPWYPTLRRFAQSRPGAWTDAVAALAASLGALPSATAGIRSPSR